MKISLEHATPDSLKTGALIQLQFEGEKHAGIAEDLIDSGEIAGKSLEFTILHKTEGSPARRLVLAGAGKRVEFDSSKLRKTVAAAVRFIKAKSIRDVALVLGGYLATPGNVTAAAEGAILGNFELDKYKSDKTGLKSLNSFTIAVDVAADTARLDAALETGRILAEAQNFARMLGNEPPNVLTPNALAKHAQEMAAEFGLSCEVLDRDRMTQLGFGALLGVAMGSAEPPVLIVLRYVPESGVGSTNLGLIGKAVTFDSGGISIKPADGMEQMKYDMMGGATVLAAMQAIAQLKPSIAVTAVIASVENMLGGRAQRPSDIVKTLSGKTVEVLNTDAEGRMILADALTYANRLGCTHLVDAATLTGAVVVALGHTYTGVFSNNDELRERWMKAAEAEGERMWHLPIDDDFKERLKGSFADLQNIGGRYGGASIAANFLKEFVDETPWVHLDIAGTAWLDEAKPWMAKGPTGSPVRSFAKLAMEWG
jgi:leucyl aminopeptidase